MMRGNIRSLVTPDYPSSCSSCSSSPFLVKLPRSAPPRPPPLPALYVSAPPKSFNEATKA
ncbi:hypothetical protein E2C01_043859 [Portunus trituberculatus]|uniref:Uncharacterized protein n=1 Tax=Portunus trituberculatus TaxID=210409 RepID=A0A5B7FXV3_PORTR|nr:hypothetical protein [Portunus trituberculatus]